MNKAKDYLRGECTLALCRGDKVYLSQKRGVSALLEYLESGTDLRGFSCADKVVGKGASFLYIKLAVLEVHACVISKCAYELLLDHGISVTYDTVVDRIQNRDKTGYCPIEESVLNLTNENEAVLAIKNKLSELRSKQ